VAADCAADHHVPDGHVCRLNAANSSRAAVVSRKQETAACPHILPGTRKSRAVRDAAMTDMLLAGYRSRGLQANMVPREHPING
jgi:hypothetical protein